MHGAFSSGVFFSKNFVKTWTHDMDSDILYGTSIRVKGACLCKLLCSARTYLLTALIVIIFTVCLFILLLTVQLFSFVLPNTELKKR